MIATARIAAQHRSFSRFRQVASIYRLVPVFPWIHSISIGSAVFAGLTVVINTRTDRQTDSPRYVKTRKSRAYD